MLFFRNNEFESDIWLGQRLGQRFRMTDVLILTEGGKDLGFGHITRCMAIYQAIEEIANSPEFIVNGDETIHDLLKDKNKDNKAFKAKPWRKYANINL